jgi:O-antigen/teichoic acid export membrane protein
LQNDLRKQKETTMASQSLKDKTVKGASWTAIDSIARYGITFIVGIILARLLSPDEYGLIGILTIFINLFNVIVDGGFTNALIRKQGATDEDYCTVFYTNLVISFVLAGTLFACAGPISVFFEREELFDLTRVMSVIVIINALSIVQRTRLTKKIDFKTQTKISIIASVLSGVIGIGMALMGCGVWSLVGQQISSQLCTSFLLWFYNKWIPKLIFSWKSFKELWDFGWKLLASSIIGSLTTDIYNAVIGKCFSPQTLGYYTRARHFSGIFSTNISTIVNKVSFPVLSTIQNDKPRLKAAYRKLIRTTMLPTFVLMLGLAAMAKPMILVLIGEQWLTAAYYLQIICLYAMMIPLHTINLISIQVVGRSDITLKLRIIKSTLGLIPIGLGIWTNNIYWMLAGSLLFDYFCYYLNTYYSGPLLGYPILEQIKDVLPSLGVAILMAVPVYLLSFLPLSPFIILPIQLVIGAGLTALLCTLFKLPEYKELKSVVSNYINKLKGDRT